MHQSFSIKVNDKSVRLVNQDKSSIYKCNPVCVFVGSDQVQYSSVTSCYIWRVCVCYFPKKSKRYMFISLFLAYLMHVPTLVRKLSHIISFNQRVWHTNDGVMLYYTVDCFWFWYICAFFNQNHKDKVWYRVWQRVWWWSPRNVTRC